MPRMSKRDKLYWAFFIDPATGRRKFNHVCRCCARDCKQSFRTELICCPKYLGKRSKEARTGIAGSRPQKAQKTANLPKNGFWQGNVRAVHRSRCRPKIRRNTPRNMTQIRRM